MKHSKEDILRIIEEENIQFIRLSFTDIFGQLKNVTVTSSQIQKVLNNEIMFDGSSIEGFTRIHESDQYLYPDLDTFAVLPWHQQHGRIARLICDVYNPDGTPFIGDPRGTLKRMLAKAAASGLSFNVGPECEFFLFRTDSEGRPTTMTNDRAGYFDLGPLDHGEQTRREICLDLEKLGFEIEASHHEVAPGQHEIDFKYSDALEAADKIMTFKFAVKSIAQKNGFHATFMPKPVYGEAGNGMHVNMSLFRDGVNIFNDPSGPLGLSETAYQFIAGVLAHIRGISVLTNPLVNSFKRLVPGYEAPCYIAWSASNRSALIRVPATRGKGTRIELRNPDPSCNPYLAFAACLAAGLDGIERKLTPPEEVTENIYAMDRDTRHIFDIHSLPRDLREAIRAFELDDLLKDAMGPHITAQYIAGKKAEWEEFRTHVTDWEVNKYIVMY